MGLAKVIVDQLPEKSRSIKGQLGVADDYFTGVAPDPTDAELAHARQVLRDLTASVSD